MVVVDGGSRAANVVVGVAVAAGARGNHTIELFELDVVGAVYRPAIVAEQIIGSTPEELRALRDRMAAMLRADGPPPNGKWDDLKYLEPVRAFPARHASTLLVFDAVVEALERAEA